jgi:hypothetical protein
MSKLISQTFRKGMLVAYVCATDQEAELIGPAIDKRAREAAHKGARWIAEPATASSKWLPRRRAIPEAILSQVETKSLPEPISQAKRIAA